MFALPPVAGAYLPWCLSNGNDLNAMMTPSATSLALSSSCVPAPFMELHAAQSSWRLPIPWPPPFDCGTIWSTVRLRSGNRRRQPAHCPPCRP